MDVLSELEALGTLGEPPPRIERVEKVEMEAGAPSTQLRDVRGRQMVEACDRVVTSLDRLVECLDGAARMMQDLKGDILEMRRIWEPPVVEDDYDPAREEPDHGEVPQEI